MILEYLGHRPRIGNKVFIAPSADIIGDVQIGDESSVWFQVVIRGDVNFIRIGERTNVQDLSCLHVTHKTAPLIIGDDVTIGHKVILHGCRIEDRVLIGMGAIVMDHAVIPSDCLVGAGSLVPMNFEAEPESLILGSPAKVKRKLRSEEIQFLRQSALNYCEYSRNYRPK